MYREILVIKYPESLLSLDFLALDEKQSGIVTTAKIQKESRPITHEDVLKVMHDISTQRAIYLNDQ